MYLQYYYLCEWEDVPPLLTLVSAQPVPLPHLRRGALSESRSSFHTNCYLFQFDYTYIIYRAYSEADGVFA